MAKRGNRKSSKDKKNETKAETPVVNSSDPNVQPYLSSLEKLANGDKALGKGFAGGAELGSLLYNPNVPGGGLGRVDESFSPDMQELYNRSKGESFLGGTQQSQDVTDALALQHGAANSSSLANPQVQAALSALRDASNASAIDNPNVAQSIQRAQNFATQAQNLDPTLSNILQLRKDALGGLNTAEMTAAREDAQTGLNRGLSTALRNLTISQQGGGPRGAARGIGALPITAQFADAQQGLERKLLLDNYEAKQKALGNYSTDAQDILTQFQNNQLKANAAEAGTIRDFNAGASTAATNFAGGVSTANKVSADAADAYSKNAADVNQFNIKDRAERFNNFINFTTNLRSDLYQRHLENLNRMAAEKSGFITTTLGGGAFAGEQAGRQQGFDLAKENLDFQKKMFGSGGGGSGGSSNSSSSAGGEFGSGGDTFA